MQIFFFLRLISTYQSQFKDFVFLRVTLALLTRGIRGVNVNTFFLVSFSRVPAALMCAHRRIVGGSSTRTSTFGGGTFGRGFPSLSHLIL
jgi:hypothetical protein